MDQSNSAMITDTADDSRRYKKPKKEDKKGPDKKADKKVREKSIERAKKAKSKGESQKEAKSKGDKKDAKPKGDKKEAKIKGDKKDAKPKGDKKEAKSMEDKKAKSKGDKKDVKGKGDKEDTRRKKDKEDTADKGDKKHKKRKGSKKTAKKKKGEKGFKANEDQITQSETEQSDGDNLPVQSEGPDQQNLGTETQPELMKKSIIEAGLSATEFIEETAKDIMALYLKTSKDSMMSLNERGSSIAGVQSLPTRSRLDVESSFMADGQSFPTGSRLDVESSFIADGQSFPTGSRLDVERSFMADGQSFPTGSRLDVERSFIADGQSLPTGSRLDVARSFIADGQSLPTGSRLDVARSFIADGQSLPTSSRLDVERSFIADGQSLPTGSRLDVARSSIADGQSLPTSSRLNVERSSVYYGSYDDFGDPRPDVRAKSIRGYSQDFYQDAPRSSQSGDRPEDKFDSKSYYDSRRSSKSGDRPDKLDLDGYDTRKDSAVSRGSNLSAKNVKDSEPNSQYEWLKERTPYMSGQKQPSGSSVTSMKEIKDISSQKRPPRTYSIMSQGASLQSINERWENESRKKTKQKSERQSVSFEVLDRRQSVDLFNETRDQLNETVERRKSSGNAMEMKERVDVDTNSEPSEKMTYEQPGEEQTSQPSDPESSASTLDSSSHTEDAASSSAAESSDENRSDGRANLSAISEASATTESGSSQKEYTATSSEVGTQTPATTSSMSLSTDEQTSVTSGSATTGTSSSVGAESDSELELELRRESGTWTRLKNNEDVTSYKGMKRHMMENQMENQIVNKEPERRSSEASKPSSMSKMLIDSTSPIKPSSKSMMLMDSTSPIATPRIESGNVAVAGSRRGTKTAIDNKTSVTSPKTYNVIVTTPQPKYKITHCHIVKPQENDVCPKPRRHEPIKDTAKKVATAGASHDDSSTELSSSEPSSPAPPKKRSSFFAPKKSRQHHQKGKKAPEKPSDEKAAITPGSYAQSPSPQSTGNDEAIAAIVSVTQETSRNITKATNEMRDAISKLAQMLNNISIGIRNLATSSSDPKSRKEDKSEQKTGYNYKQPSATGFIYSEIQLSAIEFTDCWNPCLKILNANGTLESERTSMLLQYEPDRVYPVLTYMWHVRGMFREHLELQHFPFDVQELSIVLSSDLHMAELELISDFFHPSHVDERALQESQDFIAYRHVEFTRDFSTLDLMGKTKHPILTASAHVRRRLGFYFWNVVVIVLLIIGLSMCVLAIEPSSTDRLALLLTLFLTAVAFKLVVKTTLPTISYLTYLDIYVVFTLIYLFLAAAVSAMMIHLSTFRDKSKILLYDEIAQSLLISLLILFHLIFLIYIQLTALKRRREMKRKDHEHLLSHFKKQGPMFPTEKQTQTSVSIDRKPGDPPFGAQ
ncbi:uncharacterized protein LOC106050332 isoform X2 [Biomphalaria glabrata]|uniref:Uncharacterized protein LOC106050332 isoform X2 n=1 Tax=Biomphalaria glabrata TaxID=6526 RepID=A0A9W3B5J5_BIOGL|nr:uncharacterized protein LOC106050332 isoform X2 [Biomphalaria glabrata]